MKICLRLFFIPVLMLLSACSALEYARDVINEAYRPAPVSTALPVYNQINNPKVTASITGNPLPESTSTFAPSPTMSPTNSPTSSSTASPTATLTASQIPSETPNPIPEGYSFQGPGPILAPVLMYHHVLDANYSYTEYGVTNNQFQMQMTWLAENGYQTITISELAHAIRNGALLPLKPVVITFDDGNQDVYLNAYPIMEELRFVGTVYLIEKSINTYNNFDDEMIATLSNKGWEFGSHSATHAVLTATYHLEDEVCGSRQRLIDKYGLPFESFAYPFVIMDSRVQQMVKDCGFTSAVGNGSHTIHTKERLYFISRREVKSYFTQQQFINLVSDVR
jgi:hypothetical protein